MKKFTQITNALCRYVSYLSMATIVFIMFYMTLDVILRRAFNAPITGGYEITTMVMTVLIFTSWSYTQTQHGHIHVTMFISKMPAKLRFVCFGLTSLLSTIVLGIATGATFLRVFELQQQGTSTGMLLIPHWPFVLVECISLGLFSIILLRDAVKAGMAIFSSEYAEEVMATW